MELGIPREVANSDARWVYVLLHGDDELESGWQAEWVSATQAVEILKLIVPYLESKEGYDLVTRLRRVAGQSKQ